MEFEEYINAAIQEILNPTFESLLNILKVHEVDFINGLPKAERVNYDLENNFVTIYFPIKKEFFFLKVIFEKKENIEINWIEIQSGHRTYLTATSEVLTYDELASFVNLKPLEGWSKGDLRKNGKSKYHFSRISFNPFLSQAYDLEEQLLLLLDKLEKDEHSVRRLTENSFAYISVCRHQYVNANSGLSFGIDIINRLNKLNLGIDIDSYIVGNPLN